MLYRYFRDRVYRHAYSILGRQHDSEDATAMTFAELLEASNQRADGGKRVGIALADRDVHERLPQPATSESEACGVPSAHRWPSR
ncbi:sigma factor [Curtobacterium flaccumfaciens]|nr:sigma factor [Curtobacterium flaccumfaciens]